MGPFSVVSWALLGLFVVVALAQDATDRPAQEPVKPETELEALAESVFQVEILQQCLANNPAKSGASTGERTKRQTYRTYDSVSYGHNYGNYPNYLDLGLGFRRNDYQYFPNTFGYTSRYSSYYPQDLRQNIYRLPAARFFNSFYPGPIERPGDGLLARTYFRTGSFNDALADFRIFPLQNVRTISTSIRAVQTNVAPVVAGYVGTFRDFPYEVRVCGDCCSGGLPCIRFTGQTYPFQQVTRNYVYVRNSRSAALYGNGLLV